MFLTISIRCGSTLIKNACFRRHVLRTHAYHLLWSSCLSPSMELDIGWKLVSESLNQFSEGEYIGEVAEANQNDEDEDTPALFE
jgi:hypothetical protein